MAVDKCNSAAKIDFVALNAEVDKLSLIIG